MIAMMSDLRIGSASETSQISSSRSKLTSLLARLHAITGAVHPSTLAATSARPHRMTEREFAPKHKSDSIHVRAGELHDLGPRLGVGRDRSPVVIRRAGQRDTAKAGNALLDLRIGHREVHLLVEQGDDFRRRSFRRAQAAPGVGPIARHRLRQRRHIGQFGHTVVVASARTVPALAYCSDEPVVETINCAWPAIRSVSAGASPRYGTWMNLMPAIIWNSSADM